MINYNISGNFIECIELDESDQNYLYHASLIKFFSQNRSCRLLSEIKNKINSSMFRLIDLYYRYEKGKYDKFEYELNDSVVKIGALNKEISDNSYDLNDIKELSYVAGCSLWNLKEEYNNNQINIDSRFEESHFFSNIIGAFFGTFLVINGIELGINRRGHMYDLVTVLLFPPIHIYESWKNNPQTVIDQVNKDISDISHLIGEVESLEAFNINSVKFIELVD